MFDRHEATMMQLREPMSDRYVPTEQLLAPDASAPDFGCAIAKLLQPVDGVQVLETTDENDCAEEEDNEENEWFGEMSGSSKVHGVFGHLGTMDHYDLVEPLYHVTQFYKTEGYAQQWARSVPFENVTLAVISANAIYLGIDTDNNTEGYILDADWGFQVCDHFFCLFFVAELAIRFAAFKLKRNCFRDHWFKFDSGLVILMVAETWVMPVVFSIVGGSVSLPTGPLRLLRLLRLSRLVRLVRTLPELLTMFKGMFVASRAVGCSMLMVLLLLYVFGIFYTWGSQKRKKWLTSSRHCLAACGPF